MYKVMMGHNGKYEKEAYAYARNSSVAIHNMNELFKDENYDSYKAVMFGEADFNKHPDPFEAIPQDEVDYIRKNGLAAADAYSYKKSSVPEGGTFVSKEQMGDIV